MNGSNTLVTVKFNVDNPDERRVYDIVKKTGKRSQLIKIALAELIEKYELGKASERDISSFLGGYDYISKFKKEG